MTMWVPGPHVVLHIASSDVHFVHPPFTDTERVWLCLKGLAHTDLAKNKTIQKTNKNTTKNTIFIIIIISKKKYQEPFLLLVQ